MVISDLGKRKWGAVSRHLQMFSWLDEWQKFGLMKSEDSILDT